MDPAYRDLAIQAIKDIDYRARPDPSDLEECAIDECKEVPDAHANNPFHRVVMWTGSKLGGVTLKDLGMRIKLGHSPLDEICPKPVLNNDFVVMDVRGVHEVAVDYCGCKGAGSQPTQLLAARLYPAKGMTPSNAVTFELAMLQEALALTTATTRTCQAQGSSKSGAHR
ncbi:hypothetical protein DFH09DRAFT_1306984 [Mycena vulgaris]|nr:hypothetical protein DFH09DRAFT_1306984 [Mycena vulgaris]